MSRLPVILLLAAVALGLPPSLDPWLHLAAQAQDDDGDDGGDDDGGDDDGGDDDDDGGGTQADGRDGEPSPDRASRRQTRRADPAPRPAQPLPVAVPAELVVTGLAPSALPALAALGYEVLEQRPTGAGATLALRLRAPANRDLQAARAEIAAASPGAAADLNHFYRPQGCDGPHCASFVQIGWPSAPPATGLPQDCDPGGAIGMVDTGVNAAHEALAGGRLEVVTLARAGTTASRQQHGTAIASILIGAQDSRTPGLLPVARLIAVDTFHRQGSDERSDVFSLIAGLDLLADRGVSVINLSLAGPPNAALEQAVVRLQSAGITLIASAGNGGPRAAALYPAAYPGVIAVTAVDRAGSIYRRAGQGAHIDVAAPGVEVWAAASLRGARPKTGTSFATPFVSAAAYLLASRGASAAEIPAWLALASRDIGAPGLDPVFGHGLLDASGLCSPPQE